MGRRELLEHPGTGLHLGPCQLVSRPERRQVLHDHQIAALLGCGDPLAEKAGGGGEKPRQTIQRAEDLLLPGRARIRVVVAEVDPRDAHRKAGPEGLEEQHLALVDAEHLADGPIRLFGELDDHRGRCAGSSWSRVSRMMSPRNPCPSPRTSCRAARTCQPSVLPSQAAVSCSGCSGTSRVAVH
jgi:hypothetical protein